MRGLTAHPRQRTALRAAAEVGARPESGDLPRTANHGGAFEKVAVRVVLTDGKLIPHFEVFDAADTDRALARFDELCAASSAARAAG